MAAIKINQFMRNSVASDLMERAFAPRIKAWFENAAALRREVYAAIYPPKVQELMAEIENLRGYSFHRTGYFQINIGGMYRRVDSCEMRHAICHLPEQFQALNLIAKLGDSQEFLTCASNDRLDLATDSEFGERLMAHFDADHKIHDELLEKYHTLKATLLKFKTLTQVQDHWPEIVPVFEKYIVQNAPKTEIMSIPFADLNALFQLPPEETTDALETSGVAA